MDPGDEELPFELLHPCCQKDIIANEKATQLRIKFARTDPSLAKEKKIRTVFSAIMKNPTCHACQSSRDYDLLARTRLAQLEAAQTPWGRGTGDLNSAEDSDSDIDIDDGFESEHMLKLKEAFLERERMLKVKEQLGLGVHIADSAEHLLQHVKGGNFIVLHLYDPSSIDCAKLDLRLENLSKKYLKTRFRRLLVSEASDGFCQQLELPLYTPLLVCIIDGRVVTYTSRISDLIPDGDLGSTDLFRFLDNAKVLSDETSNDFSEDGQFGANLINAFRLAGTAVSLSGSENEADEEDSNKYCSQEGCTKQYSHTHVTSSNTNTAGGGSSSKMPSEHVFTGNATGIEALGKDYFLKL